MGRTVVLAVMLCLTLTGCSGLLLERSWSSATPHSAGYRDDKDKDALRADSYQDLVNALLLLVEGHADSGVVRVYGGTDDGGDMAQTASDACNEVQQQTALGAYLLEYITYSGKEERGFYELTLRFGYRRTAEEQRDIINATSAEAVPDLLRTAAAEGRERLVVRIDYFSTDRTGVEEMVRGVQEELSGAEEPVEPWQVVFYPDTDEAGIVEILLT